MRTSLRFAYSVPKIGKGSFFPLRSVPRLIFGRAAPPSITTGVRPSLCGRLMYIRTTTLNSVHKKHKTRRYEHPSTGVPGSIGMERSPIYPTSGNGDSRKLDFRFTEFSEVCKRGHLADVLCCMPLLPWLRCTTHRGRSSRPARKGRFMRRILLLATTTTMLFAVLVIGGVAYALTFTCEGQEIVPGDDLDAIVNADSSTVATTFCIHAGTYAIDHTINVRTGDKLLGEVGATTTRGPATYPTNPPVKITNGANLTRLIQLEGENATLQWLDVSGARSLHNADGSPMTGTGMAIGGGEADGTTILQYLRVHDNDANGIGSPRGKVLNSEFFRNTLDPVFLGYAGAAVKGIYEYEAAYNYVHDEQGNGLWCDHGCYGQSTQANGFWVHHNLLVNNDRYGVRYEYSPRVVRGVHASQPSALIENNEIHANGYGGTAMQDAQNGVFRYNDFGPAIIDWVFYPHNGAGAKAMQFSDGKKTTSLYNAEAYGNTLGGEYIQGCSMPETVVYCANNNY